jgi:hypothetical protein
MYNARIRKEASMAEQGGCGCGTKLAAKPEKKEVKPVKKSAK